MKITANLIKRLFLAGSTCFAFGTASNVLALAINFEDLAPVYDSTFPCFCNNPLTDQYLSKGLIIENAYLTKESYDAGLTYENVLFSESFTQLNSIGALPTVVNMRVTSANQDAIYLMAHGRNGYSAEIQTPGYARSDNSPPVIQNFLASFDSLLGMKSINIDSFYFLRTSAAIDE